MYMLISHTFTIMIYINLMMLFQLRTSHNIRRKTDLNGKLENGGEVAIAAYFRVNFE